MSEQRKTTPKLMNELTDRLIMHLEDNEVVCPECKGLRFKYKQYNEKEGYIETCTHCYNGKLYKCKHCGKLNKTDHCDCKEAEKERHAEFEKRENEKQQKLFEQANKINFNDYDGYFILEGEEHIKDKDNIYDWLYDMIKYEHATDEDLPKFLWATKSYPILSLDLQDIIYSECENDGYEDMTSYLNLDSEDLVKAQEYLNKWYKAQGDSVNGYEEDYTTAVLLEDVIKDIKNKIKKESR